LGLGSIIANGIALDVEMYIVCHVLLKYLNIAQQKIEHKNPEIKLGLFFPIKLKYMCYTLNFQFCKYAL
jgi:hypothetical protein